MKIYQKYELTFQDIPPQLSVQFHLMLSLLLKYKLDEGTDIFLLIDLSLAPCTLSEIYSINIVK